MINRTSLACGEGLPWRRPGKLAAFLRRMWTLNAVAWGTMSRNSTSIMSPGSASLTNTGPGGRARGHPERFLFARAVERPRRAHARRRADLQGGLAVAARGRA